MERWLISVPAWGARCVDVFCATALPALENAILHLSQHEPETDPHLIVHTDQPERVRHSATEIQVSPLPVPAGLRDFDCMSQAHREVIRMGCRGDVVVLLTADLVIPVTGLVKAAEYLSSPQKKLVLCASIRALQEGQMPAGLDGEALMRWAWENRHPMTSESTWPDGRSSDLSRLYFASGDSVCSRLCLPHPVAFQIDGRRLAFNPTIDANLMHCWATSEMALAQDATELGLVELSPRDKGFGVGAETVQQRVSAEAMRVSDPRQVWCLNQKVRLCGERQNCGDDAAMGSVVDLGYRLSQAVLAAEAVKEARMAK